MSKAQHDISNFPYGQVDTVDDQTIPEGAASRALNWLSLGDRIELRRGLDLLGTEITGSGKILGLHIMVKADGTEIPLRKRGRKLEYYNSATEAWTEVGTNLFPAAAEDDEASFANYSSLAGNQCFICSPNSGLYKIMAANPGSYTDLTNTAKNFKGYIKIQYSRMFLWGRNEDRNGVYGSYIDNQQYTSVSAEALASTASGTLAFKGGGAKRTGFGVQITVTATGEVFTDDYNGVLTGSLGNTGTINYTSGAYTTTASGAGTADYQWEDSTNQGVADFTKSTPRTAGQGFVFRQDTGGRIQNLMTYRDSEYCLHEKQAYDLRLTNTDTAATNLPYAEKVGIPNWRAACPTGDGIFYIDDTDENDPQFRLMGLEPISAQVLPKSISKRTKDGIVLGVNLKDYRFDKGVTFEWGDYILFAFRHKDSTENNRLATCNRRTGAIDFHDIAASCFATYNGSLLVGDSISDNVYVAFSGYDDDDALISNYWEGDLSDLDIDELKKCKKFVPRGFIQADQSYDIFISVDNGGFVYVGTVEGDGDYVDRGQAVSVGSATVGQLVVGGGSGGDTAYYYEKAFSLVLDKFKRGKVRYEAKGIGYVSINGYTWFDIRKKGSRIVKKYR